jgi:hypothetical protein
VTIDYMRGTAFQSTGGGRLDRRLPCRKYSTRCRMCRTTCPLCGATSRRAGSGCAGVLTRRVSSLPQARDLGQRKRTMKGSEYSCLQNACDYLFGLLLPCRSEVSAELIEHFVCIDTGHSERCAHVRYPNLLCLRMPIRLVSDNDTVGLDIREHLMYSVSSSKFPFRFSYANMPGVAVAGTRSVQRRNEFCPDRIRPVFSHLAGAKRISGKREPKARPRRFRPRASRCRNGSDGATSASDQEFRTGQLIDAFSSHR